MLNPKDLNYEKRDRNPTKYSKYQINTVFYINSLYFFDHTQYYHRNIQLHTFSNFTRTFNSCRCCDSVKTEVNKYVNYQTISPSKISIMKNIRYIRDIKTESV